MECYLYDFFFFLIYDNEFTGINGGMDLRDGLDASGRKGKVGLILSVLTH